jgi:CubicO group peptidase (beta-lactamase class C family)
MPLSRSITRRHCLATLAALSAAAGVRVRAAAHDWRALQDILDTFVRERNGPGVAVAIRYGGDAPSYLSAGTIAFDSAQRFDADSLCRIYSMTKHVTRIATLLLVEDGTITLETPVAEILPEFRKLRVAIDIERGLEARPATRTMTVRHLITNTSGLGNWTPSSDSGEALHTLYRQRGVTPGSFGAMRARPGYGAQPTSLDELIARVADLPLAYEPGTRLHYSIGFDVMALVIQRAARMPYGEFLERRLFGPLAMPSTGFQVKAKDAARLTTNYDATPRGDNSTPGAVPDPRLPPGWHVADDRATSDWLKPPPYVAGGAGLVSTARDFLRYAEMLANDGIFGGARVMKAETAKLATGNIHPPGVADPSDGVGAGSRALLMGTIIPPGMVGGGGAAGTLFWIDQKRRGVVVFMAQAMYGGPARSPYQKRLFTAIDQGVGV